MEDRLKQDRRIIKLLDDSKFHQTVILCDSLISAGVKDSRIFAQKARALSAMGKKEESVPFYERALRADYQNSKIHLNFAITLMELGKIGRAITEFRVALRFAAEEEIPLIHRNLAVAYIKMNQREKALNCVREGLSVSAEDPYLNGLLAMLIVESRPARAESLFVKLRSSGEANPHFLYQFGLMLMESGRWKEAASVLEDVLKSRSPDPDLKLNLAEAWIMSGNSQKALNLLQGKDEEDLSQQHLIKIARALERIERYREALEIYTDLEPSATVMDRIGVCYFHLGENEEAIKWARRAVKARPEWPVAMINLAVVLADMGDLDESSQLLEKVLDIDPDNITAKINLERLREVNR